MEEYMLIPRICGMAEVLWSPLEIRNWEQFRSRVARHKVRLESNDYRVGSGSFSPWASFEKQQDGTVRVTLHWEVEGTQLFYKIDNQFVRYTEPFVVDKGTRISVLPFYHGMMKEKAYDFICE